MSARSRLMIASVQSSLDGYMEGANGELDWVVDWGDALAVLSDVDAAIIGGGTYPGYAQLWRAVASDPQGGAAMLGRMPSKREVEYAQWTQTTPHYVLSTTLDQVASDTARLVRDLSELRSLKSQPGRNVYVIGGPALVSNLINEGLIDELRMIVAPIILGGGKSPFAGIRQPHRLELLRSEAGRPGQVILTYRT
jgi:dihydrofolate reductase